MKFQAVLLILSATGLIGCGSAPKIGDNFIPKKDKGPPVDSGERFLIEPQSDAEGLLGRQVAKQDDGSYEILERAPGCTVTPYSDDVKWERTITGKAEKFAGFSASLGAVADLRAEYKHGIRSVSQINNERIVKADLRGNCGDDVIVSVKVGTGIRKYQYMEEKEAGGGAEWKTIGVSGSSESANAMDFKLKWDTPQAWAFTVDKFNSKEQAKLKVRMPERLNDGQEYSPEVSTGDRSLWLIVAICWDNDTACVVLRPSSDISVEIAPVRSKSWKLKPIRAIGLEGKESREKLIVYGFIEKAEYEKVLPPLGDVTKQEAADYVHSLPAKIEKEKIPSRRWARQAFNYVIEAKPAPKLTEPISSEDTEIEVDSAKSNSEEK